VKKSLVTKAGTTSQSSVDNTPIMTGHDDINQNLVNNVIDNYIEEIRIKFDQKATLKVHYKDFHEYKMTKVREYLEIEVQKIFAELKTLQKTSNPNLKKQ
jgi:hypothetical protein